MPVPVGVRGTCETMILEGEADHRDQYYSEEESQPAEYADLLLSRKRPVSGFKSAHRQNGGDGLTGGIVPNVLLPWRRGRARILSASSSA